MKKVNIGDRCYITENARVLLGLPDDVEYEVIDILKEEVEFPMVLSAEELGKDWTQFFRQEELILI